MTSSIIKNGTIIIIITRAVPDADRTFDDVIIVCVCSSDAVTSAINELMTFDCVVTVRRDVMEANQPLFSGHSILTFILFP